MAHGIVTRSLHFFVSRFLWYSLTVKYLSRQLVGFGDNTVQQRSSPIIEFLRCSAVDSELFF